MKANNGDLLPQDRKKFTLTRRQEIALAEWLKADGGANHANLVKKSTTDAAAIASKALGVLVTPAVLSGICRDCGLAVPACYRRRRPAAVVASPLETALAVAVAKLCHEMGVSISPIIEAEARRGQMLAAIARGDVPAPAAERASLAASAT